MAASADALDERAFYTELRADHASFVPVLGSGMSVQAGAPGFPALITFLVEQAAAHGVAAPSMAPEQYFETVDALARALGEAWVNEQTATFYSDAPCVPTPALQALAKVASGLIITTNYDLCIETAAASVGRAAVTLTLDDFDVALAGADEDLSVLHLHGVCTRPESIVLSSASYARIAASEPSQLVLRALGTSRRFIFLGHSLAAREEHIRRDVAWTERMPRSPKKPHLLVTSAYPPEDSEAVRLRAGLEEKAGVRVMHIPDPNREYQAAVRAAHSISPPTAVETSHQAPLVDHTEFDEHYLPLSMADSAEISTPLGRGAYAASVWQVGEIPSTALDRLEPYLVIEAEGGAGKTQELLQIARRSDRPALCQALTSFNARPWPAPGPRFVAGMHTARATKARTPRLTLDGLTEGSFTFLLDGLDEVAAADRSAVLQLIAEVAQAYPQHRYVISSRPLPELLDQEAFTRWSPMTDWAWVNEYASRRGVAPERLEAALPEAGDITELMVIPVYAAAAVSRVYAGKPLPPTALQLVCTLVDDRLDDPRIEAQRDTTRVWLDRVALAMQLSGTSEMTVEQLVSSGLHEDLDDLHPSAEMLGELAARALLRDHLGVVRFPGNVMREARAARALLEAGDLGLDLIRDRALVDLGVDDAHGNPVRSVHPNWVNLLEMLLPEAPESWREAIREFDECLVARATPSSAAPADREAAIQALWHTYLARRVWLERGGSFGNGSGDADAIVRLLAKGASDTFVEALKGAATSDERTARGNALEMIAHVLAPADALYFLTTGVRDEDAVVRRRAAASGLTIAVRDADGLRESGGFDAYIHALVDQATNHESDPMAAETLIRVAIELATDDRATAIATDAPAISRRTAMTSLSSKLGRRGLLRLLSSSESLNHSMVEELLEDRRLGRFEDWSPDEVAELAHIVAEHHDDTYWQHTAEEVLATHPRAALDALLEHPIGEELRYGLGHRLLAAMDDTALEKLLGELRTEEPSSAGAAPCRTWDREATELLIDLATEALTARRNPPPLHRAPVSAPAATATSVAHRNAGSVTDEQVLAVVRSGELASARVARPQPTLSVEALPALKAGADRNVTLSPPEVAELFRFVLRWRDPQLDAWVSEQWTDDVQAQVDTFLDQLEPDELVRLPQLMPGAWPANLSERVLAAVAADPGRDGDKVTAATKLADHVDDSILREQLRAYEGTYWADIALVRLGDAAAELRMVERLAETPDRVRRHPDALDETWVPHVRHESSAEPVAALVKAALQAGIESHELEPLYRALGRCAGLDSLRIWDELMFDPDIPSAPFLIYERRVEVASLSETVAAETAPKEHERGILVRHIVPPEHSGP